MGVTTGRRPTVTEAWREFFTAWAQTDEHGAAVDAAQGAINRALASATKPYVAWSGGKDSTVMLHLVLQQAPHCEVLHWDFGPYKMPRPIYREIMGIAIAMGVTPRVETSDEYERIGRAASHVFERRFFGDCVPALVAEGFDLAFIGLRAQESSSRRQRIKRNLSLTTITECWPLATWTWQDVWAYIVAHGIHYVSVYDDRAELVGYEHARFATFFDRDLYHLGTEAVDNVLHWRHRYSGEFSGNE
jgi:hypothetical protein